jgi:signal transduction histidine kinase/CheY-like chemotaxis protein
MQLTSPARTDRSLAILLAVLHAALGLGLNYFFPLSLFLGTRAYLGTFFGFMAIVHQGPLVGTIVLAAAACGAAARGDIGYFAAVIIEAAVVAVYCRSGKRNLAFLDACFWILPGIAVVAAARLIEGYPFPEALLSGAMVSAFAILSSTLASLLGDFSLRVPEGRSLASALGRRDDIPFRRIVFDTTCALAMAPFLMFLVLTSGTRTLGLEVEIGKRLDALTESFSRVSPLWRDVKKARLESIARSVAAGMGGAELDAMLRTFRATGPDVVSIGVLDSAGRIEAAATDHDRRSGDGRGRDLSSLRAFAEARSTGTLAFSSESDEQGSPLFCLLLPFGRGPRSGAAFTLYDTATMSALLDGIAGPTQCRGWLLDPQGRIVAASEAAGGLPDRAVDFRTAIEVERGGRPRLVGSSRELARSSFVQYADAGFYPGWTAAFVVDMGPLRAPIISFALSLGLIALAMIAVIVLTSAYASKIVVSSLEWLGRATRGFKERFLVREAAPLAENRAPGIDWPKEGVQEIVVLSRAFQEAGELLDRRYRETLAALGEAERASRARRDLLSAVGHDIRGPLAGIVGVAERLETELGEGGAAADAGLIKRTGARLGAFVEELLDRSALEDGRLELRSESFDLRALFADAVGIFHAAALGKGLSLEREFDERLPECVVGDRARLFQVLGNLIGNAVKYTGSGRVGVSASLAAEEEGGVAVLFAVVDTGPGIPPEDAERIFDPYYRAAEGAAGAQAGSGLGLAIARGLAQLMGSDISVESAVGKGSRFSFTVRLAVSRPASCEDAERAGAGGSPPIGARVLLVDDIEISRSHARRLLELAGCLVEEAADGPEAVEAALGTDFDLILMDLDLPTLDGRSAARSIASRLHGRGGARPPLIYALSAFAAGGREESSAASDFDGYIAKTGEAGPLLAAAREAVARDGASAPPVAGASAKVSAGALARRSGEEVEKDIDIEGLLDAYKGNRAFLATLLRTFVSDGAARLAELRRCLAVGDSEGLSRALHSLLNIAGSGRAGIALRRIRAWESAFIEGRSVGIAVQEAAFEAVERAIEAATVLLAELEESPDGDPRAAGE